MIGYLEGTLRALDATRALVVAGGVGYELHISLSTYYRLEGKAQVALEVYTHVREDALALYGFAGAEEKYAFEKLISISGIGPTLAQKILSGIDPADLAEAIARDDTRKLSSIPGVGKKTAERIGLELKDRLPIGLESVDTGQAAASTEDQQRSDLVSALSNLGYQPAVAEKALDRILDETPDATFEQALRAALKALMRS